MKLTQKILKELIHYDPETGVFTWRYRDIKWFVHCKNPEGYCKTWNVKFAKKVAGCYNPETRYLVISILGKTHYGHRLAWIYMTGEFPDIETDHIDQDRKNCKFENLRSVSVLVNQQNATMKSNNSSGFNGVHFDNHAKKWRARIVVDNNPIHGGFFINLEDAIKKRKQMNVQYGFHENHGRRI